MTATEDHPPTTPRAGFGRRLLAALLDGLILTVVLGVSLASLDSGVATAIGAAFQLAYFTFLEGGAAGQTLGKRALGVRVLDLRGGGSIGYGRALVRYLSRILSALPLFLGYLWMLWDGEKQTWHDKLSTSVVARTALSEARVPRLQS